MLFFSLKFILCFLSFPCNIMDALRVVFVIHVENSSSYVCIEAIFLMKTLKDMMLRLAWLLVINVLRKKRDGFQWCDTK